MNFDLSFVMVVVGNDAVTKNSIGIVAGKIVEIGDLTGSAAQEIDATGLHIFPGVIDPHVHFNEPGRERWGGALQRAPRPWPAGGGTCFFDMRLNSSPPGAGGESFDLKRQSRRGNRAGPTLPSGAV